MIDPTAIIHPKAAIDADVTVGAYSIIGADVRIAAGTKIDPHVVIHGPTTIGANNRFFSFCSIGSDPQDKKYQGEADSVLEIGSDNTFRESVSVNRGTEQGGGVTRIGNANWLMAYVHIAHDCIVGSNTIFANNATLAGHVQVDDFAILGGFTGVHQFCRIGCHSFAAIASVIVKDVPPYILVSGNTAKPAGLNREGLKRQGIDHETIKQLKEAYKVLYRNGLILKEALAVLAQLALASKEVDLMRAFIMNSERGIVR